MTLLPPELYILDEQIACGWGDTPGIDIPADWRSRRSPGIIMTPERTAKQKAALREKRRVTGGWGMNTIGIRHPTKKRRW